MYDENSIYSLNSIISLINDFYKDFFIKNPKLYKLVDDNELNTPLKIHRKFNKLSLGSDYKIIEDTYSLFLEGEIQNHCVYSYRNKIDSGKCVIYTTDYENKKYTIEITKNNRNFVLEQIKGKYNSDAPLN